MITLEIRDNFYITSLSDKSFDQIECRRQGGTSFIMQAIYHDGEDEESTLQTSNFAIETKDLDVDMSEDNPARNDEILDIGKQYLIEQLAKEEGDAEALKIEYMSLVVFDAYYRKRMPENPGALHVWMDETRSYSQTYPLTPEGCNVIFTGITKTVDSDMVNIAIAQYPLSNIIEHANVDTYYLEKFINRRKLPDIREAYNEMLVEVACSSITHDSIAMMKDMLSYFSSEEKTKGVKKRAQILVF